MNDAQPPQTGETGGNGELPLHTTPLLRNDKFFLQRFKHQLNLRIAACLPPESNLIHLSRTNRKRGGESIHRQPQSPLLQNQRTGTDKESRIATQGEELLLRPGPGGESRIRGFQTAVGKQILPEIRIGDPGAADIPELHRIRRGGLQTERKDPLFRLRVQIIDMMRPLLSRAEGLIALCFADLKRGNAVFRFDPPSAADLEFDPVILPLLQVQRKGERELTVPGELETIHAIGKRADGRRTTRLQFLRRYAEGNSHDRQQNNLQNSSFHGRFSFSMMLNTNRLRNASGLPLQLTERVVSPGAAASLILQSNPMRSPIPNLARGIRKVSE